MLFPLWVWTAIAGLGVGGLYAFVASKRDARKPKTLTRDTVDEITALVEARKSVKAIRLLRTNTGATLLDAKNRIDDWRPDEERQAAR